VTEHGTKDWHKIADIMGGGRNRNYYRARWQFHVNPELAASKQAAVRENSQWTPLEVGFDCI
jgi:hypothetical protein